MQYATAMGVLDAVRSGDIPRDKADELGIIVSVWLNPAVATIKDLDHKILFDIHRKATIAGHSQSDGLPAVDRLAAGKSR